MTESFIEAYRCLVEELGPEKTLMLSRQIFSNSARAHIFIYFLQQDQVTTFDLREHLNLSKQSIYRYLGELRELGVIVQNGTIRRISVEVGGSEAKIWRLSAE